MQFSEVPVVIPAGALDFEKRNRMRLLLLALLALAFTACTVAAPSDPDPKPPVTTLSLADITIRDPCILPDPATHTYYMVGSSGQGVRTFASKDLIHWDPPKQVFNLTPNVWGDLPVASIWAPEMHAYKGKFYLFLTFNTSHPLADQNPPTKPAKSQQPLVTRGSTTLVADSPAGPFKPFQNHAITPADQMTLDGTFWVEDGIPYMIYAREWVQMGVGTIDAIPLKDDLSAAAGSPFLLFKASAAPWPAVQVEGGTVTDGPYLYKSKSGKLFMVWSSFNNQSRYNVGLAISASGKLAGPWTQQAEPLYTQHGGHSMLFKTFDGQLMMVLHAPNNGGPAHARLFDVEDTGDTLKLTREFPTK
jgi:beta-xylosidase